MAVILILIILLSVLWVIWIDVTVSDEDVRRSKREGYSKVATMKRENLWHKDIIQLTYDDGNYELFEYGADYNRDGRCFWTIGVDCGQLMTDEDIAKSKLIIRDGQNVLAAEVARLEENLAVMNKVSEKQFLDAIAQATKVARYEAALEEIGAYPFPEEASYDDLPKDFRRIAQDALKGVDFDA